VLVLNHPKHRLDARSSNAANLYATDAEATVMFAHVSSIAIIGLSKMLCTLKTQILSCCFFCLPPRNVITPPVISLQHLFYDTRTQESLRLLRIIDQSCARSVTHTTQRFSRIQSEITNK
jgi:hypothetical protein